MPTGRDPYRYFRVEARELVDGLSRVILECEREGATPERRARILRLAHTLKGAARVVKRPDIGDRAHALEDRVAALPADAIALGPAEVAALLSTLDAIAAEVSAIEASGPPAAGAASDAEAVRDAEAGVGLAPAIDPPTLDALLETVSSARRRLDALRAEVAKLREAAAVLPPSRPGVSGPREAVAAAIDEAARPLVAHIAQAESDVRQLGEQAHALRLVPAQALFPALGRAVRDVAQALGRNVVFEGRGGDVRLDAAVLSRAHDALLHVVRNAVDHGIEPEPERLAAGKPAAGHVAVTVARRGHEVVFRCQDDGRGLDEAALVTAAARAGVARADVPGVGPRRALDLAFAPGVSTRERVTTFSGRGVGLDVVRQTAADLRGYARVDSVPGRGATFTLAVPVSLSSMPSLLVRAGPLLAALPLFAVIRARRVNAREVAWLDGREALVDGDESWPLLGLSGWFGGDHGHRARAEEFTALVVDGGEEHAGGARRAAIAIDRLLGTAQLITRPVPPAAGPLPLLGVSLEAATDASFDLGQAMGAAPVPVLDPRALVAAAHRASAAAPSPTPPLRKPVVLIVDDSLTTRMLEQSILEAAGLETDLASSAEEALTKAAARRYDLFVVDVEMPGMNGFQFVARTREDPSLAAIPAIIVSSRNDDEDRRRGAQAGARAYVVKSEFVQERFLGLVRSLVGAAPGSDA